MGIQTILFDFDGTLIDTNELIIVSFEHTFKQYDLSFSREEIIQFNGPPLRETFRKIDADRAEEMTNTYLTHNHAIHDDYVKLFPNVIETLEQLKNRGIGLGIVTSKMYDGVELGIKLKGLDKYFNTVIAVDHVTHPKPHPESVLKAMKELNGDIQSTLMVGDNSHDILAGHNAGMRTAGVAWTDKGKDYLASYKPTYMLEDMLDLLQLLEE